MQDWETYPVKSFEVRGDFEQVYGKAFAFLNRAQPFSVMLAEGSEMVVRNGGEI